MPNYYRCETKTTTKSKPKSKPELIKTTMMFYFVCIIFFFIFGFALFYIINKKLTAPSKDSVNYKFLIIITMVIVIISALTIVTFVYIMPVIEKTKGTANKRHKNPVPKIPVPENPVPENPVPENPVPEVPEIPENPY